MITHATDRRRRRTASGSELGGAYFLSLLADALARHGDVASALQALADARAFADKTHTSIYRSPLTRSR